MLQTCTKREYSLGNFRLQKVYPLIFLITSSRYRLNLYFFNGYLVSKSNFERDKLLRIGGENSSCSLRSNDLSDASIKVVQRICKK